MFYTQHTRCSSRILRSFTFGQQCFSFAPFSFVRKSQHLFWETAWDMTVVTWICCQHDLLLFSSSSEHANVSALIVTSNKQKKSPATKFQPNYVGYSMRLRPLSRFTDHNSICLLWIMYDIRNRFWIGHNQNSHAFCCTYTLRIHDIHRIKW